MPPLRKKWETIGEPRLLVIRPNRMGFEFRPNGSRTALRVAIDYHSPCSNPRRIKEPPANPAWFKVKARAM